MKRRIYSEDQKDKILDLSRTIQNATGWVDVSAYLDNDNDPSGRNLAGLLNMQRDGKIDVDNRGGKTFARFKRRGPSIKPSGLRISGQTDPRDYMESKKFKTDRQMLQEAYSSMYKEQVEPRTQTQVYDSNLKGDLGSDIIAAFPRDPEVASVIDPNAYYFLRYEASFDMIDDSDYDRETGYGKYEHPADEPSNVEFEAVKETEDVDMEISEDDPAYPYLYEYAKSSAESIN